MDRGVDVYDNIKVDAPPRSYFWKELFAQGFVQAGSRPSYAWRSILTGRNLIQEGCVWRIGDGKSVAIWGDKWIPKPSTYSIQSPCRVLPKDAKVADLLMENSNSWNVHLVRNIFNKEEADIVCNIPVSKYNQKDKLIWFATITGEFSVKSAYHLEKEIQDRRIGEGSMQASSSVFWKKIWALKVPNATKNFLWRACHNILPTKENLKKRRVVEEDLCSFCCREQESVFHCLWACPSAQDVWGSSSRFFQKCGSAGWDFIGLLEELMEKTSAENVYLFAETAREIWKRRNSVLHGGVFTHPKAVANLASESLRHFQSANSEETSKDNELVVNRGESLVCNKWEAPPHGFFKANWDIAISVDKNCMGVGVIIRDVEGQVIAAKSMTIPGVFEPAAGEAVAALHAVELCRDIGIFEVVLEGDSLTVTKAIGGCGENWMRFGQIVEDIKLVLKSFRQWRISHVRRTANEAAHGLAREATARHIEKIWMEESPECVSHTIILERQALSL